LEIACGVIQLFVEMRRGVIFISSAAIRIVFPGSKILQKHSKSVVLNRRGG
jgi:hypothetical protein